MLQNTIIPRFTMGYTAWGQGCREVLQGNSLNRNWKIMKLNEMDHKSPQGDTAWTLSRGGTRGFMQGTQTRFTCFRALYRERMPASHVSRVLCREQVQDLHALHFYSNDYGGQDGRWSQRQGAQSEDWSDPEKPRRPKETMGAVSKAEGACLGCTPRLWLWAERRLLGMSGRPADQDEGQLSVGSREWTEVHVSPMPAGSPPAGGCQPREHTYTDRVPQTRSSWPDREGHS